MGAEKRLLEPALVTKFPNQVRMKLCVSSLTMPAFNLGQQFISLVHINIERASVDGSGEIVAGISLSATRPYTPKDQMQALVPVMKAAAREISVKLGYRQG